MTPLAAGHSGRCIERPPRVSPRSLAEKPGGMYQGPLKSSEAEAADEESIAILAPLSLFTWWRTPLNVLGRFRKAHFGNLQGNFSKEGCS